MSYNPTIWNNGDIITSEKLNNIETGIVNTSSGVVELYPTELPTLLLEWFIQWTDYQKDAIFDGTTPIERVTPLFYIWPNYTTDKGEVVCLSVSAYAKPSDEYDDTVDIYGIIGGYPFSVNIDVEVDAETGDRHVVVGQMLVGKEVSPDATIMPVTQVVIVDETDD